MSYYALVCRINTVPVPGLDNLVAGTCNGYQVLVGKDTPQGSLGLFFEQGGQLSEEFATANNLIRTKNEDGTYSGGMFESNRRVKAIKMRGQKSEGFWIPLTSLNNLTADIDTCNWQDFDALKEGDLLDSWFSVPICNKYFTPKTLREQSNRQGTPKKRLIIDGFREHVETEKFLQNLHLITPGCTVTISEKLHGTSGRTGYVWAEEEVKRNWLMRLIAKWLKWPTTKGEYKFLNGTRKTICGINSAGGYYGSDSFRVNATKHLEGLLKEGEVLYYELVGYTDSGVSIMSEQDTSKLKDKKIQKQYGDRVVYSYGCEPGECKLYVYRITQQVPDLNGMTKTVELTPHEVVQRCAELGLMNVYNPTIHLYKNLEIVDIIDEGNDDGLTVEELKWYVDNFVNGESGSEAKPSSLDNSHPMEGVVVRVERPGLPTIFLKHKSYQFGCLEGYLREDENFVDAEEVS